MSSRSIETLCRALVLSLVCSACGDDGGGDGGQEAQLDAGDGGDQDAGVADAHVGFVDAAAIFPDAGADTIARALATAGSDVSEQRAEIVFRLGCEQAVACELGSAGSSVAGCTSDLRARWEQGKQLGYSDACLDSALDLNACVAVHTCSELSADTTPCDALADTNVALCAASMDAGV